MWKKRTKEIKKTANLTQILTQKMRSLPRKKVPITTSGPTNDRGILTDTTNTMYHTTNGHKDKTPWKRLAAQAPW